MQIQHFDVWFQICILHSAYKLIIFLSPKRHTSWTFHQNPTTNKYQVAMLRKTQTHT